MTRTTRKPTSAEIVQSIKNFRTQMSEAPVFTAAPVVKPVAVIPACVFSIDAESARLFALVRAAG